MLAQAAKQNQEPETLKRHREMYEDRLKSLRLTHGKSEKEVTETANNPRVFKTDSGSVEDEEESSE
jgi:hypothetical protein